MSDKLQKYIVGAIAGILVLFGGYSFSHETPVLGAPFHNITVNPSGGAGSALTQNHILVGNAANLAADVPMSGDATIVSSGALTLANVLTAGGPFGSATTTPIITWDAKGRLTVVSSATVTPAASSITAGQAVTRTNDTNVTMTLNAPSSVAALSAYSMTLGWTGLLAPARGGTGTLTGGLTFSTLFEGGGANARYSTTLAGAGLVSFGNFGADVNTGGVSGSAKITYAGNVGFNAFARSPVWYCSVSLKTMNKNGDYYIGMGDVAIPNGSPHTFTNNHIGFKVVVDGVPVARLFATQADGTTENASSALTTVVTNDGLELYAIENPTAGFDYYWSKNSGAISSATNLGTTNLPVPSGASPTWLQVSASNDGNASVQEVIPAMCSYGR